MNRVLISGYYGFRNAGDEAVLEAMLVALRERRPDLRVTVLSADPRRTEKDHQVDAVGRTDFPAIWWHMRRADLFISGGGGLLQDVTSDRNLVYYSGLIVMARMAGTPVMIYGQGIGPVRASLGRFLLRQATAAAELITVRDEFSATELKRLGITGRPIHVTADPALALPPPETVGEGMSLLAAAGIEKGTRPLVGFALRPWQGSAHYATTMARAASYCQQSLGAEVVFVPMQFPHDLEFSREVAAEMKTPAHVLTQEYRPRQLVGIIGQMDFLVGVRLHALIFAALAGVPILGLAYDPKVNGFLQAIGYDAGADLAGLSLEDLLYQLETAWRNRDALAGKIRERLPSLRERSLFTAELALQLLAEGGERS